MSANDSTSSRCTHSRSPSRSPPYGRHPPRNSSRYNSYNSHHLTAATDDYWELRERSMPLHDERYTLPRYPPYYHDNHSQSPSRFYASSSLSKDFRKPSHSTSMRYESGLNRTPTLSSSNLNDADASNITRSPTETYNSLHLGSRDRRYRTDRLDSDRRNRDRCDGKPTGVSDCSFAGDSYRPPGSDSYDRNMQGVAFSRDSADWHRSSGRRTREYSLSSLSKEGATDTRIDVSSSLKVEHSDAAKEQYMSLDQSGFGDKNTGNSDGTTGYPSQLDDAKEAGSVSPPSSNCAHQSASVAPSSAATSSEVKRGLSTSETPSPSSIDDTKENTKPHLDDTTHREPLLLSQHQIVSRIDEIENDITRYEEMLEQLITKRGRIQSLEEDTSPDSKDGDGHGNTDEDSIERSALLQQLVLQKFSVDSQPLPAVVIRHRPQLVMDQIRTYGSTLSVDPSLHDQIISTNQRLAKANTCMDTEWTSLYGRLEDYPCYKSNLVAFDKLKVSICSHLAGKKKRLKLKEDQLKRKYKKAYLQWTIKNKALDQMRGQEDQGLPAGQNRGLKFRRLRSANDDDDDDDDDGKVDAYTDGIIFTAINRDVLRFGGGWTSDSVHSDPELKHVIDPLDSTKVRNPEMRAKKTTATIPPMILDSKERQARIFDDSSKLIMDPLAYYHTGAETDDMWNQQEMTVFMESYLQHPKQFGKVAAAVGTKTASQCVLFYYRKKAKVDFKALVRKRRRGGGIRKRDQLAAAIKRATTTMATHTRGTATAASRKNKGSSLMADIGKAQVSQRVVKETNSKTREQRGLEEDNAYWEGVAERRKAKRSVSTTATTTQGSDSSCDSSYLKRRVGKRTARTTRRSASVIPGDSTPTSSVDDSTTSPSITIHQDAVVASLDQHTSNSTTSRWTDQDKIAAVNAFQLLGRDFVKVSEKVGSKTDDQCRNFYFNHKRKYGSNAFGEGDDGEGATPDSRFVSNNHGSLGLNSGEQAHIDVVQTKATKRGGDTIDKLDSVLFPGRRRARTTSGVITKEGRASDGLDSTFTTTWKRTTTTSDIKRGSNSSYWSVSERGDFMHLLEMYGRDWTKIASIMTTKSATQVRNFYHSNEQKFGLDKITYRHEPASPTAPYNVTTFALETLPPAAPPVDTHSPSPITGRYDPVRNRSPPFRNTIHHLIDPPSYHPRLGPRGRDILNPSPSSPTVTRVSDLLNDDEPNSVSNHNDWESWFGS